MAFNRNLLRYALPFPPKIAMHDQWIGLIAELYAEVYFCEEKLIGYRKHDNNQTPYTGVKSKNSIAFKLYNRIEMAKQLVLNRLNKNTPS